MKGSGKFYITSHIRNWERCHIQCWVYYGLYYGKGGVHLSEVQFVHLANATVDCNGPKHSLVT